MFFEGFLSKMQTHNSEKVRYFLDFDDDLVEINTLIGKKISIIFQNQLKCFCGKIVASFYRQNFCKQCFFKLPQASESIMKPELCKAHLGVEVRDLEWEKQFELQSHIVYLAISGAIKVGITRNNQIPTRWIDQGAEYAIEFAEVPNRYLSGAIEVELKKHISDKTNWRKMLSNFAREDDLLEIKTKLKDYLSDNLKPYFLNERNNIYKINFPISKHPEKPKSVNLIEEIKVEGTLSGIKGQYLIFENGNVFNVRNHEGFLVRLEIK